MMQRKNAEDFVLATGETHSVKEFVSLAFKHAGVRGLWSGEGMEEKFRVFQENTILAEVNKEFYRPAELTFLHGDSSLAREELGWTPKISFDKLVQRMVECDLKLYEERKS